MVSSGVAAAADPLSRLRERMLNASLSALAAGSPQLSEPWTDQKAALSAGGSGTSTLIICLTHSTEVVSLILFTGGASSDAASDPTTWTLYRMHDTDSTHHGDHSSQHADLTRDLTRALQWEANGTALAAAGMADPWSIALERTDVAPDSDAPRPAVYGEGTVVLTPAPPPTVPPAPPAPPPGVYARYWRVRRADGINERWQVFDLGWGGSSEDCFDETHLDLSTAEMHESAHLSIGAIQWPLANAYDASAWTYWDGRADRKCMHVCMYACMHVCMYACMHACMYVCMHICMYVCMYVCHGLTGTAALTVNVCCVFACVRVYAYVYCPLCYAPYAMLCMPRVVPF